MKISNHPFKAIHIDCSKMTPEQDETFNVILNRMNEVTSDDQKNAWCNIDTMARWTSEEMLDPFMAYKVLLISRMIRRDLTAFAVASGYEILSKSA